MSASQPIRPSALGISPTPLHRLDGLMRELPDGPELLIKREDLCGVAAGGCKTRKLTALLADAQSVSATVVLTTGFPQSNHCAITAVAAAMRGLRAELHLIGPDPGVRTGNLRICEMAGATITFTGERDRDQPGLGSEVRAARLRAAGEVPYAIPLGGSTPLGAAGYASVVPELLAQLGPQVPTHLVTAAGSLGTMAGLILGTWAAGLDCQVHGYSVLWPEQHARDRLEQLLEDSRLEYFPSVAARPNYRLDSSELGAGYGIPTSAGHDAARLAARRDGVLLDSTYTAKAMAGLIHGITAGTYRRGDKVVFFHTGGLGGLLAGADTADPPLSISDEQHQRPAAAPTGSDSYEQ
jgi:1-aminocyclopropane-1-carboxylate deaminase/D-cysteine desulfhydrase-like pyridoxal-dependent ACC family enzyme